MADDSPKAAEFRRRAHQKARQHYPVARQISRLSYEVGWLAGECEGLARDNRKLRRELSELQEAPVHDARLKALNGALKLTEAALAKGGQEAPSREARLQELARATGEASAESEMGI